jgi:hypothetical protein
MITEYDDELDYYRPEKPKQKRFLIGHLGMYGDILYALAIARQLKQDYPGCHVTWGVASMFKSILDNNPYIDSVWDYEANTRAEVTDKWFEFAGLAEEQKQNGEYDEIFLSQVFPGNPTRLYDTIRQSIFRAYPSEITVPIRPVIMLSQNEIDRVKVFAEKHDLKTMKNVILFESSPGSGQSGVTPDFVMQVAEELTKIPRTVIILSGKEPLFSKNPAIIDGSGLSLRETVELTKYCTFLIGSSSGVTWICQSEQAKPLPTVQILTEGSIASLINDHTYHNQPTDDIIELVSPSVERVVSSVTGCLANFADAKARYNNAIVPDFAIVRFHARAEKALIAGTKLGLIAAFIQLIGDYGVSWDLMNCALPLPQKFVNRVFRKGG